MRFQMSKKPVVAIVMQNPSNHVTQYKPLKY